MRVPLALALAGIAALSLAAGGRAALGKFAMLAGMHSLAADLSDDPLVQGVAHYRAGDYAAADAAFEAAGRRATYDRGLSLAATGDYALSVAYFDAVLFADIADAEAQRNRDIVAALVEPVVGEAMGEGRIAAAISRIGAADSAEAARLRLPDASRIRKPLDYGALAADADWLGTIVDDPGEFLRQRLQVEFDRRTADGLVRPPEPDPW